MSNPGNANLPIGGLQDAIQENGVPGMIRKLFAGQTFELQMPVELANQLRIVAPISQNFYE